MPYPRNPGAWVRGDEGVAGVILGCYSQMTFRAGALSPSSRSDSAESGRGASFSSVSPPPRSATIAAIRAATSFAVRVLGLFIGISLFRCSLLYIYTRLGPGARKKIYTHVFFFSWRKFGRKRKGWKGWKGREGHGRSICRGRRTLCRGPIASLRGGAGILGATMPDLPTRTDLFAIGRNYVTARARKIDPAQIDIIGSDANLFVGATSYIASEIVYQIAQAAGDLLLDSSRAEKLDRFAWDRYQEIRKGASSGLGEVTFYRDSLAGGAGSIPIQTRLATKTGVEYITTTTASFSTTTSEARAYVRSVQAGRSQQVGANAIRIISQPSLLFDPSMRVNNEFATAHADDTELDPVFCERIRGFWKAARRGTLDAISYGATQVAGVESASAVEVLTPYNQPARVVDLYVADSSGIASSAIADTIREELKNWRAAGIQVAIYTCAVQIVTVKYKLTFRAGIQTAPVTERIRATTVESVNSLGGNATLFKGKLQGILNMFASSGLIPDDSSIVEPAGDIIPERGKTIRTTIENVTVL